MWNRIDNVHLHWSVLIYNQSYYQTEYIYLFIAYYEFVFIYY